jgi:hypothetical protein
VICNILINIYILNIISRKLKMVFNLSFTFATIKQRADKKLATMMIDIIINTKNTTTYAIRYPDYVIL